MLPEVPTTKLRIFMIATSYYPTIGGLEDYMRGLSVRLVERGHKVTILTIRVPDTKKYEYVNGVEIKRLHVPRLLGMKQIFWFLFLSKEIYKSRKKVDILHAYPTFMTGVFCSLIGKLVKKPVIIREGMSSFLLYKVLKLGFIRTLGKYALRNLYAYTNNPKSVDIFREYNFNRSNIKILRTPVDTVRFKPLINKNEKKREMGFEDKFILLYVGRLLEWKNVQSIIAAMPKIISEIPEVMLLLVGDGEYRKELEILVKKLDISEHVRFHGFVLPKEVVKFFQIADIFVALTTHSEKGKTFSHPDTTVYQAMACGIPIISPPDMQIISDEELSGASRFIPVDTGLVINSSDPRNFIDAVVYLYKNSNTRRSLGEGGRLLAMDELSWEKHVDEIENIYTNILTVKRK